MDRIQDPNSTFGFNHRKSERLLYGKAGLQKKLAGSIYWFL